jgi:hypothetical protein
MDNAIGTNLQEINSFMIQQSTLTDQSHLPALAQLSKGIIAAGTAVVT